MRHPKTGQRLKADLDAPVLFKDTGFQGFEPDNVWTYQPKKKPRTDIPHPSSQFSE
jgi:hypothetical protein